MWDRSCPTPLVMPQDTIVFDSGKAFPVYCALELSVADPPSRNVTAYSRRAVNNTAPGPFLGANMGS